MSKTVNVHLAKNWFAPGGVRWRAGDYQDFPKHLLGSLPSSATVNDGSGVVKAADWQAKNKAEVITPKAAAKVDSLIDPGAPGSESEPAEGVAANGESESPASPKSSGPETQALPGQEVKTGAMTTASGTKPEEKAVEIAADKAKK